MLKRVYYIIPLLVLIGLLPNKGLSFQGVDDILFEMLEENYERGQFKIGLHRTNDLGERLINQSGSMSMDAARVLAWRGLFMEALSDYDEASSEIDKASTILKKVHVENSKNIPNGYIEATIVLARAYMNYGGYLKAEHWLNNALTVEELQESYHHKLHYYLNVNLYKRGYYNTVIDNLPNAIQSVEDQLAVTKHEQETKDKLLAHYYLLELDVLHANGSMALYKQKLDGRYEWVKNTFKYKYGIRAEWEYRKGLMAFENNNFKLANKYFKKSAGSATRYFERHSPFYAELQRKRIDNFLIRGKYNEANYWNNDLDVKIQGYYGKKSLAYLHNKLVDIEEYLILEQYKRAEKEIEVYDQVTTYYPKVHEERLKVAPFLYEVYIKSNQYKKAEKVINEAVEAAKYTYGEDAPAYHFWLIRKARYDIRYSDNFKEAEEIYLTSIFEVLQKEVDQSHPMYYEYAFDLTDLYTLQEKYDKAEAYINRMMDVFEEEDKNTIPYAYALRHKAELHISNGEYNYAQEEIDGALAIYKSHKDIEMIKKDHSKAYRTKAQLQMAMGDFDGALESFIMADNLLITRGRYMEKPSVEEVAELNIYLGKYEKTLKDLDELIASRERYIGEKHWTLIGPLSDRALLYIETGKYNKAEASLLSAQEIITTYFGETSTKNAEVLMLYKRMYAAIGDYERAEKAIRQALTILELKFGKDHIKLASPMSQLALEILFNNKTSIVASINDHSPNEQALLCQDLLSRSLKIIEHKLGTNNAAYAEALKNEGLYHLQIGQLVEAKQYINEARDIWANVLGEKNVRSARLDFIKGNIAYYREDYKDALFNFKRSAGAYEDIFDDNHPNYVEALGMSGRMNFILGNEKEAVKVAEEVVDKSLAYINTIFSGLSERGKANYWEKVKGHFEFYNTMAFTYHKEFPEMIGKVFDINLQTKSILLSASVKIREQIMGSGDSALIASYVEWASLKEKLATSVAMSPEQRKLESINVESIEGEIEALEKFLGQRSSVFESSNSKNQGYAWEDLKKVIGKNDAVIEIVPFRKFETNFTDTVWYAALSVSQQTKNNPDFVLMKNGNDMNNTFIKYYRNCIKFSSEDKKSYDRFWAPLKPLVKDIEGTIYLSVDGVFNRLNLEAIPDKDGKFLIEKYDFALIGTSRDLIDLDRAGKNKDGKNEQKTAVLVGNPSYYRDDYTSTFKSVTALEGTAEEVEYLSGYLNQHQWKSDVLTQHGASEEKIKNVDNPTIFHVATHGFYVEQVDNNELDEIAGKAVNNPLFRSGLLLENGGELIQDAEVYEYNRQDGILTAFEAMNLKLEKTDLVVLSACETGLGEVKPGEGVFGLQRAFTVAGAENIIISLFKVSDEVTTQFMKLFYEKWLDGNSKRDAFRAAKIEIKNKYQDPKLWGAFLMIGVE